MTDCFREANLAGGRRYVVSVADPGDLPNVPSGMGRAV